MLGTTALGCWLRSGSWLRVGLRTPPHSAIFWPHTELLLRAAPPAASTSPGGASQARARPREITTASGRGTCVDPNRSFDNSSRSAPWTSAMGVPRCARAPHLAHCITRRSRWRARESTRVRVRARGVGASVRTRQRATRGGTGVARACASVRVLHTRGSSAQARAVAQGGPPTSLVSVLSYAKAPPPQRPAPVRQPPRPTRTRREC